jgi:hypothetical protein
LIEKSIYEFSKMESEFTRGLDYGVYGAGVAGLAANKMLQPSTGVELGDNLDPFAPGKKGF